MTRRLFPSRGASPADAHQPEDDAQRDHHRDALVREEPARVVIVGAGRASVTTDADADAAPPVAPVQVQLEDDAPFQDTAGPRPSAAPLHADVAPVQVRSYLLAAVRAAVREAARGAPAVVAMAAYRDVAADGDLGLAACARFGFAYSALILASAAAVRAALVVAGHPLATAHGFPPVNAVRDILVVLLAVTAAWAAVNFQ